MFGDAVVELRADEGAGDGGRVARRNEAEAGGRAEVVFR
jgi:hypothetical protein